MLIERRLPGYVAFDEAGFGGGLITMTLAKDIAKAYIMRGYVGWLSFYLGYDDDHKYDNRARFEMNWGACQRGSRPIRLRFRTQTDVAAIIARCKEIGMTQEGGPP